MSARRDIGGRYADLARAMGGWSERVERPEDIAGAFARARKATEGGQADCACLSWPKRNSSPGSPGRVSLARRLGSMPASVCSRSSISNTAAVP